MWSDDELTSETPDHLALDPTSRTAAPLKHNEISMTPDLHLEFGLPSRCKHYPRLSHNVHISVTECSINTTCTGNVKLHTTDYIFKQYQFNYDASTLISMFSDRFINHTWNYLPLLIVTHRPVYHLQAAQHPFNWYYFQPYTCTGFPLKTQNTQK